MFIKSLLAKSVLGFSAVGMIIAANDMLNAHRTIVYDQIYAQDKAQSLHSPSTARIIARKYGHQLSAAFAAEPECRGLSFSRFANRGLIGRPGRWRLNVDMAVTEDPEMTPTEQPWSLLSPNRDGSGTPDAQVISDKGSPASIVKEACSVVNNTGG